MDTYAVPMLGNMDVAHITHQDVLRVLNQAVDEGGGTLWETKTDTATRIRGRIESVLSWATVSGFRTGDNPARWAGNLKELLPRVLVQHGEGLWTEWSQKSEKYDAKDAARVWRSLKPSDTGYQAVFAEAQRQGWVNPSSNAAQLAAPAPAKPPAELLDAMDVDWTDDEDAEVPNIVEGLVVDEDVTLLGGHGGIGKSFLALQMACAVALGQPVLGQATRQMRVLYYSAEDGRKRLKRRLRKIVAKFNYDPVDLRGKLRVLDASEMDPLFSEVPRNIGTKEKPYVMKYLGETENFTNLQALVADFDPQLVIVDGGSDTFDGNEIARREVRAFTM